MTNSQIPTLFLALAMMGATGCSNGPSGPNPRVVMETSMGNVTIELFQDRAPISVKNFLTYVDNHHYDGTIFHRGMDVVDKIRDVQTASRGPHGDVSVQDVITRSVRRVETPKQVK